jgi:hypothetical protein
MKPRNHSVCIPLLVLSLQAIADTSCVMHKEGYICQHREHNSAKSTAFGKQEDSSIYSLGLMPNFEYYIQGYSRVSPDCKTSDPGTWTITKPPKYGVTRTDVKKGPSTSCPGVIVDFGSLYYTWTSPYVPKVLTDEFKALWRADGGTEFDDTFFMHNALGIMDRGPDLFGDPNGGIVLMQFRTSEGGSGPVESQYIGSPKNSPKQVTEEKFSVPATTPSGRTIFFDRLKVQKGKYHAFTTNYKLSDEYTGISMSMTDEWRLDPPTEVLGIIKYTQYNTPNETSCKDGYGDPHFYVERGTCTFHPATLKVSFVDATNLNGTGYSIYYGLLKAGRASNLATRCAGKFPDGATIDNSFPQVDAVIGACGVPLVGYGISTPNSMAMPRGSGYKCGAVFSRAFLTTQYPDQDGRFDDICPVCSKPIHGVDGHIDQYAGAVGCTGASVGDLGLRQTMLKSK